MDPRKSKKTRFHGEGSKHARDISSPGPDLKAAKDRVKSAPVFPPPIKHKQDARQKHVSHSAAEGSANKTSSASFARPPSTIHSSVDTSSQELERLPGSPTIPPGKPTAEARPDRTSYTQPQSIHQPREITVAVLGESMTGKSTFIQCALDLKRHVTGSSATKKVSLEGEVSTLRLLEIPMSVLELPSDCGLTLPLRVGGQDIFHIDGALVIYDVMDKTSIARIPKVLSKCYSFVIPRLLLLVATAFWLPEQVHCKLAYMTDTTIPMNSGFLPEQYTGNPSIFQMRQYSENMASDPGNDRKFMSHCGRHRSFPNVNSCARDP